MLELDSAELARPGTLATAFDEEVLRMPDIDRFCSSTRWIVPAHPAFHAGHPAFVAPLDSGFVALARGNTTGLGRFYAALEAMWGLACPLIGRDPAAIGKEAALALAAERERWDVLWLGGILRDGPLFNALVRGLGRGAELRLGPLTTRHQASLAGGFDGWLGRRSAKFRKMTRQALREFERSGLTLEWIDTRARPATLAEGEALFARIHAVEQKSWKGKDGTGFVQGDMRAFYQHMVPRLAANGELRALIARQGGEDVAFCFGGVFGDTFRGLQNSFDARLSSMSLGNVMQAQTIMRLGEEGIALYDLGSEMAYKLRWAEGGLSTVTLIAVRR